MMAILGGIYRGPSRMAATGESLWQAAFDAPLMSSFDVLWGSLLQGAIESPVLGTVIRDIAIPPVVATSAAQIAKQSWFGASRMPLSAFQPGAELLRDDMPGVLSEDEYKASPHYRDALAFEGGLTEARARAKAEWFDLGQVRKHFSTKRPVEALIGGFLGAALDPVNYIPVAGPLVRGAAIARLGRIGGTVVTGAVDAVANTAVFSGITGATRGLYGDDVSFQSYVSDLAMAGLIGGAFGGVVGFFGRRADPRRAQADIALQSLKNTQRARVALNEASVSLGLDGSVKLSPTGAEAIAQAARDAIPDIVRQSEPAIRVPSQEPVPLAGNAATALPEALTAASAPRPVSGLEEALANLQSGAAFSPSAAKKPVIDMLKRMGGVHPDSPLAAELRNIGVTPKTAPGLFRREAKAVATEQGVTYRQPLTALDNVPLAEVAERFDGRGADDGAGYVSQQAWIDAIDAEMRGEPWLTPGEQRHADDIRRPAMDLDEFMSRYGIDWKGRPLADVVADIKAVEQMIMAGDYDLTTARDEPGMDEGEMAEWQDAYAHPADARGMSASYRIDPTTGSYLEQGEISQLAQEGRLTDADKEELADADRLFVNGSAYGDALKSAVSCLL